MIQLVPNEILTYIFSFLGPYELPSIASVSKHWNNIQKTEELWKRHCLDYSDNPEPFRGSWKERFKIIHNWMHAKSEKKTFSYCKNGDRPHDFTILKDNTALEVYPEHPLSSYAIHHFSKGKSIRIDNAKLQGEKIVESTIFDKTWVVLTKQGKILFFDLLTGKCVKKMIHKNPVAISRAAMTCKDQEVITAYNKKIQIWDINTCCIKQTIDVSELDEIYTLNSTPNFIICTTHNRTTKTINIHKNDWVISEIENLFIEVRARRCTFDSGSYFGMLCKDYAINIFEDTGKSLNLIRTFEPFMPPFSEDHGCIYIHKNWLMVSKDDTLKIYDIKTGTELSTIQHNQLYLRFCSNASHLFTRVLNYKGNSLQTRKYTYTIYNFEPRKVSRFRKCSIQ